MKKLLFIFLIPFFSFTQSGDTNGDGFVNLEDLFNVLENWLEDVNENEPEAISNLDEMIDLVDSLITINQNTNYGRTYDIFFPEGYVGEVITSNVSSENPYTVPVGKRLYILGMHNSNLVLDGVTISMESNMPLILSSGEQLSSTGFSGFNGLLTDETDLVNSLSLWIGNEDSYVVPDGKRLYILGWYSGYPIINGDIGLSLKGQPLILQSGQELNSSAYSGMNGYLVDEDYFASFTTSTNQSLTNQSLSTPILFDSSEHGNSWECEYVNNFPLGSIIHNVLIGESSIVVPGPACGSDMLYPIIVTESFQSVPRKDFLWCFTVSDTISMNNLPLVGGSYASYLYYLEDYTENYDPNSDTYETSSNFIIDGQTVERILSITSASVPDNDVALIPGKIYGWQLAFSQTGSVNICDFEIVDLNIFNNYGLWEEQNNEYWELTDQFPCIPPTEGTSNFHYYPFGKKLKTF